MGSLYISALMEVSSLALTVTFSASFEVLKEKFSMVCLWR